MRAVSGSFADVLITPHSTNETAPPPFRATTPNPVTAVPGSIPRMI
jgi:hypothetical protein